MRFLLDQNADGRLLVYLRAHGHDAVRVDRDYPSGLPDPHVLALAFAKRRILITNDTDFGDLAVHREFAHAGVILFRLPDNADLAIKIERLHHVLTSYADDLDRGRFLTVKLHNVRVRSA